MQQVKLKELELRESQKSELLAEQDELIAKAAQEYQAFAEEVTIQILTNQRSILRTSWNIRELKFIKVRSSWNI